MTNQLRETIDSVGVALVYIIKSRGADSSLDLGITYKYYSVLNQLLKWNVNKSLQLSFATNIKC